MEGLAFTPSAPVGKLSSFVVGNGGHGLGAGVALLMFCFQSICPETLLHKALMSV